MVELVYDLAPALDDSTVDLILAEISRIDPERRPLYTQFVMEAIQEKQDPSNWHRMDLLRYVLARERERRWDPAHVTDADRLVVAFGTLCEPFSLKDLTAVAQRGAPFEKKLGAAQKRRIGAMLGVGPVTKMVPSLKPDILGTMFVLDELQSLRDDDSDLYNRCISVAWEQNPDGVKTSTRRAVEEFAHHPEAAALIMLAPDAPAIAPAWSDVAAYAIKRQLEGWSELIEQMIQRYESSLDAVVYGELWSGVKSIVAKFDR